MSLEHKPQELENNYEYR